jgi:predicted SAM-dependent methyltransferase
LWENQITNEIIIENEMIKSFLKKALAKLSSRVNKKKYIRGTGIEIGALHKPLDLYGLDIQKVMYVDRLSNTELRRQYPELIDLPLVTVDLVTDGSVLDVITNDSLDFIIANHVIEHLDNPIRALENWCKKLKPGGIVYMAVPDKRFTFDKDRPSTTNEHLLEDYLSTGKEMITRNRDHYITTAEIIEKRSGKDAEERVNDLIARNYSIHFHAWDFKSFKIFLEFIISQKHMPYTILDFSRTNYRIGEFIFILCRRQPIESNFRIKE